LCCFYFFLLSYFRSLVGCHVGRDKDVSTEGDSFIADIYTLVTKKETSLKLLPPKLIFDVIFRICYTFETLFVEVPDRSGGRVDVVP